MENTRITIPPQTSRHIPIKNSGGHAQFVKATAEAPRKHVSVAGIFKKPAIPAKAIAKISPKNKAKDSHLVNPAVYPGLPKLPAGSSQSSSPNIHKESPGTNPGLHPLANTFKESTTAYRTHLYNTTAARLDDTLSNLLNQLHASNLATSSWSSSNTEPPSHPAQASTAKCCKAPKITTKAEATHCENCGQTSKSAPLLPNSTSTEAPAAPTKHSIAEDLDHTVKNAFRPIGSYNLDKPHTKRDGSKTIRHFTLAEVFSAFEKQRKKDMAELKALEAQWEKVVGEIYKLGTACIGDEAMKGMGLLVEPKTKSETSQALSTLFDVGNEEEKTAGAKGSGTAQDSSKEYPAFLTGPSVFANKPLAPLPDVPEQEVQQLEKRVAQLGVKQVEDLRKIEEEHARWWNKKCEQIAQMLQAD